MTNLDEWKRINVHDVVHFKNQYYEVVRKDIRTIEPRGTSLPVLYLRPSIGDGIIVTISKDGFFSQVLWDDEKKPFSDNDRPCDSSEYEICSAEVITHNLSTKSLKSLRF